MTRRNPNYPFRKREEQKALQFISWMFASFLFLWNEANNSDKNAEERSVNFHDGFYDYKPYGDKYDRLFYHTCGILSILLMAGAPILNIFCNVEMGTAICLQFFGCCLTIPFYRFTKDIRTYYIFNKNDIVSQKQTCKQTLKSLLIYNVASLILSLYPLLHKIQSVSIADKE